jgi:nitrate/nitrite transporter NarK
MHPHPRGQNPRYQAVNEFAPKKPPPPPLQTLFSNLSYMLTITYGFTVSLGLWFPNFGIQLFAESHGISEGLSAWLLAIINLSSTFGRIIPNWLADRYGVFEVYIPLTALTGILGVLMLFCTTPASIVVFCILCVTPFVCLSAS